MRTRQVKGYGKLPVRRISEIHPGTIIFKTDGTSGELLHKVDRGTSHVITEHRIFTRIKWDGEEKPQEKDLLAYTQYAVDIDSFNEAHTNHLQAVKNEAEANELADHASKVMMFGVHLETRRKIMRLQAIDLLKPGEREKRIVCLEAKLAEIKALSRWLRDNEYGNTGSHVGSIGQSHRHIDKCLEEITKAIGELTYPPAEDYEDMDKYVAAVNKEIASIDVQIL